MLLWLQLLLLLLWLLLLQLLCGLEIFGGRDVEQKTGGQTRRRRLTDSDESILLGFPGDLESIGQSVQDAALKARLGSVSHHRSSGGIRIAVADAHSLSIPHLCISCPSHFPEGILRLEEL